MFLYGGQLPQETTFTPNLPDTLEREGRQSEAAQALYDASRDLQIYRDNANAEDNAIAEAYERRNKAIFEATGVQLQNPRRDFTIETLREAERSANAWDPMERMEREWQESVDRLGRERPDVAGAIGAGRSIRDDAYAIARSAELASANADRLAEESGLGIGSSFGNSLFGAFSGMARDPLQVGALGIGGGIAGPAKTLIGRIAQTVLTEAAINGGVEAGLQAASYDWKREAGLEHGVGQSLEQIGLAGLFGGGVGGLIGGGREVARLLGRSVPDELIERAARGEATEADLSALGEALGRPLDPETSRLAALASEQDELDRIAFGAVPDELDDAAAERLAAAAVRDAEAPIDGLPTFDAQERYEQIDRLLRRASPVGREPNKPQSLIRFLAREGIRDDGGDLAAMDLDKLFVPGRGRLVRQGGMPLDTARELAAQSGYLDGLYGNASRASAESLPDDLLELIRREAGGEPVYSIQEQGTLMAERAAYDQRLADREEYRRVLESVDSARGELGIDHRLDDDLLERAARFVSEGEEPALALERSIEEDYRAFVDALDESGEGLGNEPEFDIPWEDLPPRTGEGSGARGDARPSGRDDAPAGRRAGEADSEQFPGAGSGESQAWERQPLRGDGATPEPASPQAAELADLTLTEARSARTAPAEGEADLWDVMPAGQDGEGRTLHASHKTMIEEAERDELLGDVIASCKD